ncbi:hypothetical protein BST97_08020 [Nonlabens spongiae]|uniref:Bacteriophage T5 Orf172 DNA-binding domain-containing protein n=1 Tax=Nonlabens spongiae TaxID=331648 RepID=A0A1W6MK50_9FLAO|nr:GIY-YIG nuclease family protein [Nonlabens spongiae]ARN77947.1 hypothetical protein BST97_08020 [Nonlabens spongiae]
MSKKQTLEDIFKDDEFGILDSRPITSNVKSEDERLIESFQEINTFYEKHHREPEATNVTEFKLLSRLKALRNDTKKTEILKPYDSHNLLNTNEEVKSVADIINDDDLGLLDTEETLSIFKIKNVPNSNERAETDFVARRKPMSDKNFAPYEVQFKQVQQDLKVGKRRLKKFQDVEQNLYSGNYYVLDGVLLFLEDDGIETRKLGTTERKDGRTTIVFENGTKSNMYYRSLSKSLYTNGSIVSETDEDVEKELFDNANLVNEEDAESGWIYVLKSKSIDENISSIQDLYKIGFSTVPIQERVKNASKEATYLFADVTIVSGYKCYNLNAQKFESLIHRFFAEVCLDIDIHDDRGRRIMPREWFVVPLNIIDKVIKLILSGDIVNYKYDSTNQRLVGK